ncbi:MAG: hypothetical protein KDD64_09795 [Bdellovibrionales bacterium]|nr:hypothetical protein [Bdellovibrionales bacterium]
MSQRQYAEVVVEPSGQYRILSTKVPLGFPGQSGGGENFFELFQTEPGRPLSRDDFQGSREVEATLVSGDNGKVTPVVLIELSSENGAGSRVLIADNSLRKVLEYRQAVYRRNGVALHLCGKLSHDINNYLSAIAGANSSLERAITDENLKNRVTMIHSGVEALVEISAEMADYMPSAGRKIAPISVKDIESELTLYLKPFSLFPLMQSVEFVDLERVQLNMEQFCAALSLIGETVAQGFPFSLRAEKCEFRDSVVGVRDMRFPPGSYVRLVVRKLSGNLSEYQHWVDFYPTEFRSFHPGISAVVDRVIRSQGGLLLKPESSEVRELLLVGQ